MTATLVSMIPAPIYATQPPGCFVFTQNGQPISPTFCNPNANDIEIKFKQQHQGCSIQFTLNGTPIGNPIPCPHGANDVELFWAISATGAPVITKCTWTHKGQPIAGAACPVPPNANDAHFFAGVIVKVFWTIDGQLIKPPIKAPPGANDVEFSFG
jgi:hypothetical protein